MTVGEKIKLYREHKGISQEQFASRINNEGYSFGQTALSNIECGARKPTYQFAKAFANAFPKADIRKILFKD